MTLLDEAYQVKKKRLINEIQEVSEKQVLSLKKERSNLFRPNDTSKKIDVRSFNKVLHVDKDNLFALIEGMTTYEEIVKETLKYGCLPPVVPELNSITIGGALAGCGIESSSFRYGLVHETIQEFEVLLPNGQIVLCTPHNEHKDLFFAFPNSYGTLGYALKVKVQLIPVKKYVRLTHLHFSNPKQFFSEISKFCKEGGKNFPYSFIEGVIFDRNEMVITLGEMVDDAPYTSNYKYMQIYYRSLQNKKEDYLTMEDYIWRWDPDWFWCSDVFYMQNPILRTLFGKWMLKSKVYTKINNFINRRPWLFSLIQKIEGKKESIIQDVSISEKNALKFFDFFMQDIGIKPVWICPVHSKSSQKYTFCPMDPNQLHFDFGFWLSIPTTHEDGYYNKKIEEKVIELEGFKSLYSLSYYSKEQFWKIYNHDQYRMLKQKYDPEMHLGDLYHKITEKY